MATQWRQSTRQPPRKPVGWHVLVSFVVSFSYVRSRSARATQDKQPKSRTLLNQRRRTPTELESVLEPAVAHYRHHRPYTRRACGCGQPPNSRHTPRSRANVNTSRVYLQVRDIFSCVPVDRRTGVVERVTRSTNATYHPPDNGYTERSFRIGGRARRLTDAAVGRVEPAGRDLQVGAQRSSM